MMPPQPQPSAPVAPQPQVPTPTPVQPQSTPVMPTVGHGNVGSLVAVIVILAAVIIGALYFWNQRAGVEVMDNTLETETIPAQSTSDATADIDADLNSTDVDNIDAGLNAS